MVPPNEPDTCVAIMGQWPSFYVHKWMRVPKKLPPGWIALWNSRIASLQHPLRPTSRSHTEANTYFRHYEKQKPEALTFLANYIHQVNDTLRLLRPVLTPMTTSKPYNNTIVVMVCNQGQSDLFLNFVCSARSRGLDLSQVLLFATDAETKALGDSLGINTFYDTKIFGALPKSAADRFFDATFAKMVLAKVCCAHLINLLGYNILLQDVDVMWYQHPLEFFSSPEIAQSDEFDMYFQDTGSRTKDYESFYANTGFYFARANSRTNYYFSVLVRQADLILAVGDDQLVMNGLINEHTSSTGLRVKTVHRDDIAFPGGYHYHSRPKFMKELLERKLQPYVFHMSWTVNKIEKRHFLEQMGEWHVSDQCANKPTSHHRQLALPASSCCMAKPIVTCHYRDKPSIKPCRDSPPLKPDGVSFW